jgi:hypothetical protein
MGLGSKQRAARDLAFALAAGVAALSTPVLAAETFTGNYGPLKSSDNYPGTERFWTRIDKDGTTAWSKAAETALRNRGFSDAQVAKFVHLQILPKTKDFDGDYVRGKAGIVKISADTLPLRFNTETGITMPFDPVAFANALPDCYAKDERTCTFKFSGQVDMSDDTTRPCLLPRRTVLFCQRRGFLDKNKFNVAKAFAKVSSYAPSCGESERGNGCGADEVVFDDGREQTKLTFAVAKAEPASPPGNQSAATAKPATPSIPATDSASATATPNVPRSQPATPVPPRLVYHANRVAAFVRREGPKELEEWEYDTKAYLELQKKSEKASGARFDALMAEIKKRFAQPLRYCWPHDVYHPCDLE